ncbi:MAG: formylglycine-generating enzyme family protein [Myxococcales bacterium]|nr:formylglycine-generating enzyme family protein [Myxococcales bacterium]
MRSCLRVLLSGLMAACTTLSGAEISQGGGTAGGDGVSGAGVGGLGGTGEGGEGGAHAGGMLGAAGVGGQAGSSGGTDGGAAGMAGGGLLCGDGVRQSGEQCDGNDLGGQDCSSVVQGPAQGKLGCGADCKFDTSECAWCGNGKIEVGEECDGWALGGATCASAVGPESKGSVTCTSLCTLNTSGCTKPSCQGLANTCGSSGNDSCCATDVVTGGTFPMGRGSGSDAASGGSNEQPEHDVIVDTFGLDRYEVTVGRFRKFVDAVVGGWKPAAGAGKHSHLSGGQISGESGWDASWNSHLHSAKSTWDSSSSLACDSTFATWTPNVGANENKPQNCVNWYQAYAFCIWDGGFLPTEAEWEYAAAGGSDNRLYPWGSQAPSKTLAVYGCLFNGTSSCEAADLPVVGSTPAGKGKYGQMDLAGSLWEWTLDWYDGLWYSSYSSPGSCKNCANVNIGSTRVERGGDFISGADSLRAACRYNFAPANRSNGVGWRCARTPH